MRRATEASPTNEMTQTTAADFDRIKARPAYELVAEAIERNISPAASSPATPSAPNSELVKQFGVNRSTVREGIRLLEQSGLVAREASRRLLVAAPHYRRLATRMSRALILQQVTFRELWGPRACWSPRPSTRPWTTAATRTWPTSHPTSPTRAGSSATPRPSPSSMPNFTA